jgi:hypothetical protein
MDFHQLGTRFARTFPPLTPSDEGTLKDKERETLVSIPGISNLLWIHCTNEIKLSVKRALSSPAWGGAFGSADNPKSSQSESLETCLAGSQFIDRHSDIPADHGVVLGSDDCLHGGCMRVAVMK